MNYIVSPRSCRSGMIMSDINGNQTSAKTEVNGHGIELDDPANFINRELSWLKFNERVLEEAADATNPLLERLRFATICESNLDEFYMVRVAGLKQKVANDIQDTGPDALTPHQVLNQISDEVNCYYHDIYELINNDLTPELSKAGIEFVGMQNLNKRDYEFIENRFREEIYPVLTPLAIDPGHPFPRLANRSLNLGILLHRPNFEGQALFAVVQVPSVLPRLYKLPSSTAKKSKYVWLEEIISHNMDDLFSGFDIKDVFLFKITRDSDLIIEEDEVDDLLMTIQQELRKREKGSAVRLEIEASVSDHIIDRLKTAFHLDSADIFYIDGPLPIAGYKVLFDDELLASHSFKPFTPISPVEYDNKRQIFSLIRKNDILIHHPFESFSIVEDFVDAAADDPKVLGIKQTLYRTGGKSRILDALIRAARNGKQVTTLVELKARFDEETNIQWAKKLEEEGIHVVYGLMGFKTHAKVCLVVRKEEEKIQRYVHLSSGNYNATTARLYTDTGLFTNDKKIAEDITHLFNSITGYSKLPEMNRIFTAPGNLKKRIIRCLRAERKNKADGKPARVITKMNSLVDADVIKELYLTSQAGVKIDLIVRGICCLRPGIAGISENITVRSIVGRLLEHSRLFYFENGDEKSLVYLASADWMPRNFNRRIETMFPIESGRLRDKLMKDLIPLYMRDNVKTRILHSDGIYTRVVPGKNEQPVIAQEVLIERSRSELEKREKKQGAKKTIVQKEKKLV